MLMMAEAQEAGRNADAGWVTVKPTAASVKRLAKTSSPTCFMCGGKTASKDRICGGAKSHSVCAMAAEDALASSREYAPQRMRLTRNLLNKAAGEFWIAYDTPHYCDPGSESYHSM